MSESMAESCEVTASVLPKVILKPRHALPFFKRHPWVFAGAIRSIDGDPQAGEAVALHSHEGDFIAHGLFNQHSQVRVRLYSWNEATPLDGEFWKGRLQSALQLRERLFGGNDEVAAYRLVNSEADGISGLTVDRYDRWMSVQFTSLAIARRQEMFIDLLRELVQPAGILLRTEKGTLDAEGLEISDGLLWGEPPPRPLTVIERNLKWQVDLIEGHKTGGYLDQRDNRRALAGYVKGHRVLDVFCYT